MLPIIFFFFVISYHTIKYIFYCLSMLVVNTYDYNYYYFWVKINNVYNKTPLVKLICSDIIVN